jgi:hypothetical protein
MPIRIAVPVGDELTITAVPALTLRWHVGPIQPKGDGGMPLEVSMSTEEKCRLAITPMTPGGQPAPIDGDAQWSVEGSCTLEPIDATSAWVIAGDSPGDSVVTIAADADLGTGVVPLADTATIHVANPMAANLGLQADQPVLKTA